MELAGRGPRSGVARSPLAAPLLAPVPFAPGLADEELVLRRTSRLLAGVDRKLSVGGQNPLVSIQRMFVQGCD